MNLEQIRNYQESSGPTSMVSLIVPPTFNLSDLRQKMRQEKKTATNIKDKTNRQSVSKALGKISEYLKGVKSLPDTGIALYSEQYI